MTQFSIRHIAGVCAGVAAAVFAAAAAAAPVAPENLGAGLREMLQAHLSAPALATASLPAAQRATVDERGRVLVDIHADGRVPLQTLAGRIGQLDAEVLITYAPWRRGIVSAFVPLARMTALAKLPGVSHAALVHKPLTNVGATTAQADVVLRSALVNDAGVTGAGITVGVMSDSYNTAVTGSKNARDDVNSGDLPNLTNGRSSSPA